MSKHKHEEDNQAKNPFEEGFPQDSAIEEGLAHDDIKETDENQETKEDDKSDELETLKNQYVRLAADFDNFRKRQAQERESLLKYGAESTLKLLLPVIDTYYRGKKACDEMDDATKLKENFEVIFKQLFDALDKAGLKKIDTVGQEFNPNLHEAVMQVQTTEQPDNTVVEEMQAGYMLADRVLRPAMVSVAVNG